MGILNMIMLRCVLSASSDNEVEMGVEPTLMWKLIHFTKRRMTGREVHALVFPIARMNVSGSKETNGEVRRTYRSQLVLALPLKLRHKPDE